MGMLHIHKGHLQSTSYIRSVHRRDTGLQDSTKLSRRLRRLQVPSTTSADEETIIIDVVRLDEVRQLVCLGGEVERIGRLHLVSHPAMS